MVVREARRVLEGRVHVLASHLVRSETCAHNEGDERGNEERGGEVVVIGGILVDILASTSGRDAGAVRAGGSVPGHVRAVQGGVGANVAAAVKLISEAASQSRYDALAPLLVSMVGADVLGRSLIDEWRTLGLSTRGIVMTSGGTERTPTLVSIFDSGGEVAASIADVHSLETGFVEDMCVIVIISLFGRRKDARMYTHTHTHTCSISHCEYCSYYMHGRMCLTGNSCSCLLTYVWFGRVYATHRISRFDVDIRRAAVTVLDANLSERVLSHAAALACTPSRKASTRKTHVWFEPVSVAKSRRFRGIVRRHGVLLDYVSPNVAELVAMANALREPISEDKDRFRIDSKHTSSLHNSSIDERVSPDSADTILFSVMDEANTVLESGVRCIILTMGEHGAAAITRAHDGRSLHATVVPAITVDTIVNVHGAGDALAGGCISGIVHGMGLTQALARGVAASAVALRSEGSRISADALRASNLHAMAASVFDRSHTVHLRLSERIIRKSQIGSV